MSCRVLGRGVEGMVLREILAQARERGVEQLLGVYRPTARNGMVSDHYGKLGFSAVRVDPDGATWWRLATDAASEPAPVPMHVRRLGIASADSELVG